jgi:NAD(P)H-quinone oxidoreductase subunit 4
MSGFVSELTIFLGLTTSEVYSSGFKTIIIFLSAVGLLITPIYLLSMLRRVFFGKQSELSAETTWSDAKPRELSIAFCLLIPIIGIGLYPKIATQTYDITTASVAAHLRDALPTAVAKRNDASLYARSFLPKSQESIASPSIPSKLASIAN